MSYPVSLLPEADRLNNSTENRHETDNNEVLSRPETERRKPSLPRVPSVAKFFPTKSKDEVPLVFRERYVEQGFRAPDQPWYYYPLSILQLHNESMNIWTHIVAFLLLLNKLYHFNSQLDFINNPHTWPLLAGIFSGMTLFLFSCIAHCVQSKSEIVHYLAFMLDYCGIGIYGLGSVILHFYYCSETDFYNAVEWFFIPLGALLSFLVCACCSFAKITYNRPYPFSRKLWQIVPVLSLYAFLISPIAIRIYTSSDLPHNPSLPYHISQIFWFWLSGLFFASDIPQRWYPGRCDHFLHGHQLFHICIAISSLNQFDGVFLDFQTRSQIIHTRAPPTLLGVFGPVVVMLIAEVVCVAVLTVKLLKKTKIQ